jgi:general secretion pathway protein J
MKRDSGMTLIELVAAMAVFAVVAVMGLQSLTGMLRTRDRLAEIDTNTSELSVALARLRNDLAATTPLLFYPPDRQAPKSALYQTDTLFSLSIGGQPALDGSYHRHRAQWRHDPSDNTLYRRVWTTLTPANSTAQQPEIAVMQGINGLRIRSYWPQTGWANGLNNPNNASTQPGALDGDSSSSAPEVYSDTLPIAIEITLSTDIYGDIPMVEAFR